MTLIFIYLLPLFIVMFITYKGEKKFTQTESEFAEKLTVAATAIVLFIVFQVLIHWLIKIFS